MPAPSSESQPPEAWPASIYGHLRESADLGVAANSHFDIKCLKVTELNNFDRFSKSLFVLGHPVVSCLQTNS